MNIYLELLLLAAIVVYIVDLSGWTQTWLGWLSKFTRRYGYGPVKELRPLSCSLCMTWWTGLAWALIRDDFSVRIIAYVAALSFLSLTLRELFIFIRETLTNAIARLNRWING